MHAYVRNITQPASPRGEKNAPVDWKVSLFKSMSKELGDGNDLENGGNVSLPMLWMVLMFPNRTFKHGENGK